MATNNLWKSAQRPIKDDADAIRKATEADQSLVQAARSFDSKKVEEELKKYDSKTRNIKGFARLLR